MGRQSRYPEEFRRTAAALVLDSGRSTRDVGRELGVNHETLRNWVQALHREHQDGPAALGGEERAELARLRRLVAELELKKEILRRAAVFFARRRATARDTGRGVRLTGATSLHD